MFCWKFVAVVFPLLWQPNNSVKVFVEGTEKFEKKYGVVCLCYVSTMSVKHLNIDISTDFSVTKFFLSELRLCWTHES